jgi:hypothetical protein
MSAPADVSDVWKKDRDGIVRCVEEAYDMLDLIAGVNPNGPVLVWLAEQLRQLRRVHPDS